MHSLSGFLPATSGKARVAGCDVVTDSLSARRQLGYLPENVALPPDARVDEYLEYRGRLKGLDKTARAKRREEALDACQRYPEASDHAQTRHVACIDAAMTELARWQASCPINAAPYVELLAGAWAQARGHHEQAVAAYTRAADAAQDSGVCSLEGYANQRAANILLAQGQRRAAVGYFDDAYHAYGRWGATALQRGIDDQLRRGRGHSANIATLESVTMDALDLSGALELAQVMFDARTLEEVIDRLLHAVNDDAGILTDRLFVVVTHILHACC